MPRLAILLIDIARRCDAGVAAILSGAPPLDRNGAIDGLRLKKIVRIDLAELPREIALGELCETGPVSAALAAWASQAGFDLARFQSHVASAEQLLSALGNNRVPLPEIGAALDGRICELARYVLAHVRQSAGDGATEELLSDLRWRVARRSGEQRKLLVQLREARDQVRAGAARRQHHRQAR